MAGNTSTETANNGALTSDEAANMLVGPLLDSASAAPENPESEAEAPEELDAEATETEEAGEADAELEYEADDEAEDDDEEPLFDINGQQVTLDEIGKGYLRQQDYTVKTQELAKSRKEMTDLKASIAAERAHLKRMLEMQPVNASDEPDWVQLATDDPLEYTRQRAIFDAKKAEIEAKQAETRRLQGIEDQENQRKFQQHVANQSEMMQAAIPELTGEKASEYKANISTYMIGVGYSKEELSQLFDHRAVIMADKARKYDALMAKETTVKKKLKKTPTVLRPGSPKGKKVTAQRRKQETRARLRKSGSIDDAVASLMG